MKEAIIKSIAAVICVVIVCLTVTSAVGTYNDAALKVAELTGSSSQVSGGNVDSGNVDSGSVDAVTPDAGSDAVTPDAGTDAVTPDAGSDAVTPDAGADTNAPATNNQQAAALTKADVIKLFNTETAKAAKGSYKLTRTGKFVKNINVGSATDTLNGIIKGVDENSDLDSVVGGFLGIKKNPITGTVTNGKLAGDVDAKYMIKGMTLTDADVTSFSVNGNKYTIEVKATTNPTANSAMGRATNDYITFPEVNKSIANEVGNAVKVVEDESKANYKKIIFTATIVDGKITALEYSYSFDATLKLKLAIIGATGTGEAAIAGKYTDIKY
ncbi:MAG: hypothetical protein IJZ88_06155 [Clostridia bacterium]|nr:hypothetical protein [Clostridia bacterium]